jgi:N-myristoyl transferase
MQAKDVGGVHDLLERYLNRFQLNQAYSKDEIDHWLVHKEEPGKEQVVWSYVVEDPETHKITDFVSFYSLPSSVIQNPKHKEVRAAYLYYYATEAAFKDDDKVLKERLLTLINDALILAKRVSSKLNSIDGLEEEVANVAYRLVSTSSTLSLSMTTLSSSSSSSSVPVTDSCITTSSTTALPPSPVVLTRRIFQMIRSGEVWVLFSCKKFFLFLMHCREQNANNAHGKRCFSIRE